MRTASVEMSVWADCPHCEETIDVHEQLLYDHGVKWGDYEKAIDDGTKYTVHCDYCSKKFEITLKNYAQ